MSNSVLPLLSEDLAIIQKLSDEPNELDGLSADELKARFDAAGEAIQRYLNEVLLPYLSSAAAADALGVRSVPGLRGSETVQQALEALVSAIDDATVGMLPDGSVTEAKLADGAVSEMKLAALSVGEAQLKNAAVSAAKLQSGAVTNEKTDFSAGFAPSGPILLTRNVHYVSSEAELPSPGQPGRLMFVLEE